MRGAGGEPISVCGGHRRPGRGRVINKLTDETVAAMHWARDAHAHGRHYRRCSQRTDEVMRGSAARVGSRARRRNPFRSLVCVHVCVLLCVCVRACMCGWVRFCLWRRMTADRRVISPPVAVACVHWSIERESVRSLDSSFPHVLALVGVHRWSHCALPSSPPRAAPFFSGSLAAGNERKGATEPVPLFLCRLSVECPPFGRHVSAPCTCSDAARKRNLIGSRIAVSVL